MNIAKKSEENMPWAVVRAERIEAWQDAVLGAGLDATQMSRGPINGSLVFAEKGGVAFSSGRIGGQVSLKGSLSETGVVLGAGLSVSPGSRLWLDEVETGTVAVYLPGDTHESFWRPDSMYASAALSLDRLEELAADHGLVLTAKELEGTGINQRPLDRHKTWLLEGAFRAVHSGRSDGARDGAVLGDYYLDVMIDHLGREPRMSTGPWGARGSSRTVARARDFIEANLRELLTVGMIAKAAQVSKRTLHRAFIAVLDETPQTYVLKLRLNRLRQSVASDAEAACSVALLAEKWGLKPSPRLMRQYLELFGERRPWPARPWAAEVGDDLEQIRRMIRTN